MIVDAILSMMIDFGTELHTLGLPYVTELPWGMDSVVSSGISGYKGLADLFPPFETILTAFLIYIGFRFLIQVLKGVPFLGRMLS